MSSTNPNPPSPGNPGCSSSSSSSSLPKISVVDWSSYRSNYRVKPLRGFGFPMYFNPDLPGYYETPQLLLEEEPEYPAPSTQPVHCYHCSTQHLPYSCPSYSCQICYAEGHHRAYCRYLRSIPHGADFNRDLYQVVCQQCSSPFDTERWVCSRCPCPRGKLNSKSCYFCYSLQHSTSQCTDKINPAPRQTM